MATTRRAHEDAFTLVEMLVVVLVVGLLSAIAIPMFLGQQERAKDAQAVADLGNAEHALLLYSTANEGGFTTSLDDLADYGYASTEPVTGTRIHIVSADDHTFCIEAVSSTGNSYRISGGTGVVPGTCP